jgi:hypothetical protein
MPTTREEPTSAAWSRLPREEQAWRRLLTAIGISMTMAGAVAVFLTDNEAGSAALVAAGASCSVIGVLWDRLKTVKGAGLEVELVGVAQRKLSAAHEAELRGDGVEAARLRAEAQDLLAAVRPWAAEYEHWRSSLPSGPQRTRLMEDTVAKARATAEATRAAGHSVDPLAIKALFEADTEGSRVTALGLMQGDPDAVDLDLVLGVIAHSRSAFEQAHALLIADQLARGDTLDTRTRERLLDAAAAALETEHVKQSRSRRSMAEAIIERLSTDADARRD